MAEPVSYNGCNYITEDATVADKDEAGRVAEAQAQDIQQIKKRLDLLDQRLDNIDSMVSAVAERVMSQPITLNITCPRCGRNIELTLIGSHKPAR
jgi:ABC-type histidine transport system ATPase subunit